MLNEQEVRLCVCVSVFDDGDEKTLRRTSLCLKGERHFAESEVSLVGLVLWYISFHRSLVTV